MLMLHAGRRWPVALGLALAIVAQADGARAGEPPRLVTHQSLMEELGRATDLKVEDAMQVLAFVMASLPETVTVYPTESYYYFSFVQNGTPYAGAFRFARADRDQGKVHFSYYKALTPWRSEIDFERYLILDAAQGVTVERVEPLRYRVTYQGKSIVFALNDLSQVKPPEAALGPNDSYLGPVFDDSGVRYFLVFNTEQKIFHFILDETVPPAEELLASPVSHRILIGRRTGFAYYRDPRRNRKILIGAFEPNSRTNTYFDGPFDQLPENVIEGESLRSAIVASDPEAAGQIDPFGNYTNGDGRYLVHPYMLYAKERDLARIDKCATARAKRATFYRCFVIGPDGKVDPDREPPPSRRAR